MNESKATRYQRSKRRAQAAGIVAGAVVLTVCAFTGAGAAITSWCQGFLTSGPLIIQSAIAMLLLTTALLVLWEVAVLPAIWLFDLFDRSSARSLSRDGRRTTPGMDSRNPFPESSWRAQFDTLLIAWPAAFVLAALVCISGLTAGSWWWLVAGALTAGLLVGALHLAPGFIARAAGAEPIERPALVERLGVLARQIKVPIASINSLPPAATVTNSALVAGAGEDRRVFIADGLLRDWTDEEITVVVAHELAHHAHHDLWSTLALDASVLAAGFWFADRARQLMLPVGASSAPQLDTLPLVALVASAVWLAAAPVRHAVSRWQERRADAFALRLTGSADAFQAAIRRLAAQHLSEERPSTLTRLFYHRHPSAAERLRVADAFQRRG